jgi:ribosomal protein S18 acetylase RimI-like enzyme
MPADIEVRPVRPDEYEAVGAVTVAAYGTIEGYSPGDGYAAELRDVAGRSQSAEVLAAVDGNGSVLGGVTFVGGFGPLAEFEGSDEAGMRMLAVAPAAQGHGVGRLLTQACIDRARASGRARLVLHTTGAMTAAHRLYQGLGFVRAPERDFHTPGGLVLEGYVLQLDR